MDTNLSVPPSRGTDGAGGTGGAPGPLAPLGGAADAAGAAAGTSGARKVAALIVAIVSDAISIGAEFVPPVQWCVDVVTALILFAILGFRWPLLPVLVIEAIPGLAAFPTWTLVVAVVVGVDKLAPRR